MDDLEKETVDNDAIISKNYNDIEKEKEERFVNLMIEIIVSITMKQIYEESD